MAKAVLAKKDHQYATLLKEHGVLAPIDESLIDGENGVVVLACSDPFRRKDLIGYKERLLQKMYGHNLIFPILVPGGALCCASKSPLNPEGSSLHADIIRMIMLGMKVLQTTTVHLYHHAPCGGAQEALVSYPSTFDIMIKGKEYVRKKISAAKISLYHHIDRGNEMNTYFWRQSDYLTFKHGITPVLS